MIHNQRPTDVKAPAAPHASPNDNQHRSGTGGHLLVADLSEFFTRRKHGRGCLYLPLARVENRD